MWPEYENWRTRRHERAWRRRVAKMPDPDLAEWLEEMAERLRRLGEGGRGLSAAREHSRVVGGLLAGIYSEPMYQRLRKLERRWWEVGRAAMDRYSVLQREQYRRLHATGEVTVPFAEWAEHQPRAWELLTPDDV